MLLVSYYLDVCFIKCRTWRLNPEIKPLEFGEEVDEKEVDGIPRDLVPCQKGEGKQEETPLNMEEFKETRSESEESRENGKEEVVCCAVEGERGSLSL